jgi:hypothetical protein
MFQQQQPPTSSPLPLPTTTSLLDEPPRRRVDTQQYLTTWRIRLGLSPTPDTSLHLIDIPLAMKILHRSARWRILVSFLLLQLMILIVLLVYCFYSSQIDVRFWARTNIKSKFIDEPFMVVSTEYDVQGNSNIQFQPDSQAMNLDPFTLNPMPLPPPTSYQTCTLPPNQFNMSCLPYERLITFKQIRSWQDFTAWVDKILLVDPLVQEKESYPPFLTGSIRIRQIRSKPCPVAEKTNIFNLFHLPTNSSQCYPGSRVWQEETMTKLPSFGLNDSAFYFSTAAQLATFQSPINLNEQVQGTNPPEYRGTYYDIHYPNSGYAFELQRCDYNSTANRKRWAELISHGWILPGSTRAIFISMDLFDPVLNVVGMVVFGVEYYSEGGNIVPWAYSSFIPIPSTTDGSAIVRYVLVSLSIVYIIAVISRTITECRRYGWKGMNDNGISPFWRVLDLASMISIQTALWLSITTSLSPVVSALTNPKTMGIVTECNYTSFIDGTSAVMFNVELINLFLSFSLLLTGFQMFRVGQLYSRLSIPFSIMEKARYELIGFFILFTSLVFFFSVGGTYLFGTHSDNFNTIWASIVNVIMVSSYTHQVIASSVSGMDVAFHTSSITASPSDYFNSIIGETTYLRKYELSPLLAATVFYGFLLVIMMFFLHNVLLGIILSAYKVVMHDMNEDDNERRERADVGLRGKEWLVQTFSGFWHHQTWNRFRAYVETLPEVNASGLVEETKIREIFLEITNSESVVEALFSHFVSTFGVKLTRVDDAILLLAPQPTQQQQQQTSSPNNNNSLPNNDITTTTTDFNDDPEKKVAWERAKRSGQLLLSLTYVQTLMSQYDLKMLNEKLQDLDVKQRELKSFFDSKVANRLSRDSNNPWAPKGGVIPEREIVKDPTSGGFVVYHKSSVTQKIRFVGVFDTYLKAKIALEQAERAAEIDDDREKKKQNKRRRKKQQQSLQNEPLIFDNQPVDGGVNNDNLPDDDEVASLGSLYDDIMDHHGNRKNDYGGTTTTSRTSPQHYHNEQQQPDASTKFVEESDSILQKIAHKTYLCGKSIFKTLYNWYVTGMEWLWYQPPVLTLDARNNWVDQYNNRLPNEKPISVMPLGFIKHEQIMNDKRSKAEDIGG